MAKGGGRPDCPKCHGRGAYRAPAGYVRCDCVRGTKAQRAWNSYINSIGAKHPAPKPPTR